MRRASYLAGGTVAIATGIALGLTGGTIGEGATGSAEAAAFAMLDPAVAIVPVDSIPAEEEALEPAVIATEVGSASFYANSLAGNRTASGTRYNPREMVAAHQTLPFGSLLRVTNKSNGEVVKVRVVDRGPFARGRVLDLSRAAAEELGFIRQGHTQVRIEVLEETEDEDA